MEGLKYFFPGPVKLWCAFIILFFLAIGCQRGCRCLGCGGCNGCTTSVIVDSESKKLKIDDIKIKVIANKNRITNRKLRLDSDLYVDKTIWFSVNYNLNIIDRPQVENICEYEIDKGYDLDEALDRFNIKFSPDKQHFAVGVDNVVYEFFHIFEKGVPFSSGCFYLNDSSTYYLKDASIDFKDINWKKFPNPDVLFDKIIVPNNYSVWTLECNRRNVLSLLEQMPPGNQHEIVLIEDWYNDIAEAHFKRQRVESIVKASPQWTAIAGKSLYKYILNSNSDGNPELGSSLDIVLWMNESDLLNKTDSLVFSKYFAAGYAGNYFVERFKNISKKPNNKIYNKLLAEARKIGIKDYSYQGSMPTATSIDLLMVCKDYNVIKAFISINLNEQLLSDSFFEIKNATIDNFEDFPKDIQDLLVKKYQEILMKSVETAILSDFQVLDIFEFLKGKISCNEFKKLIELYQGKISNISLPNGCR
jgi:hypothetical protein